MQHHLIHNLNLNFWDEAVDCWMVGSSGFRESWNIGNNEIASYGKAGELTASFNQGVVDTLSGQAESAVKTVRNPGKALKKVGADYVSYGKKNPANFLPSNYIGAKIVDGFVNQCRNSYLSKSTTAHHPTVNSFIPKISPSIMTCWIKVK